ncbi:MAG: DUF131 domain-containing protein [Thermoplasmata archaeon]|nr:DUF131 domain-containing protein [Thermoplasmata archaeon]
MNKWLIISLILLASAIALLATAISTGDGEIILILIFPVILAYGPIAAGGSICLFVGIITLFFALASHNIKGEEYFPIKDILTQQPTVRDKKFGGVVMLGPVPIAFGSDRKIATIMVIIGLSIFFAIILLSIIVSI